MKRISNFLNDGDLVLEELKPDLLKLFICSRISLGGIFFLIASIILCIIVNTPIWLTLIPILFILGGFVPAFIQHKFTTYYITSSKIIIETGILGRDYDIVKRNRILDVNLDVSPIDTIFKTGCIKLCTANEAEPVELKNVRYPKAAIQKIQM